MAYTLVSTCFQSTRVSDYELYEPDYDYKLMFPKHTLGVPAVFLYTDYV